MVESGDSDAAVEQVRTALTLTARWRLLEDETFPLSRAELPAQLKKHGYMTLAIAGSRSGHARSDGTRMAGRSLNP